MLNRSSANRAAWTSPRCWDVEAPSLPARLGQGFDRRHQSLRSVGRLQHRDPGLRVEQRCVDLTGRVRESLGRQLAQHRDRIVGELVLRITYAAELLRSLEQERPQPVVRCCWLDALAGCREPFACAVHSLQPDPVACVVRIVEVIEPGLFDLGFGLDRKDAACRSAGIGDAPQRCDRRRTPERELREPPTREHARTAKRDHGQCG